MVKKAKKVADEVLTSKLDAKTVAVKVEDATYRGPDPKYCHPQRQY